MADKRISQLVDRGTVVNNDVIPIVVSGATTTNKATISSIQTFMQGNLDVGVTSVGITLGSSGTDVSVSGSPVTSSGNITINIPDASSIARGLVNTAAQAFAGPKMFFSDIVAGGVNLGKGGGTGADNVRVGVNTLDQNTTGANNTAVGARSLQTNSIGQNNTAVGLNSLQSNAAGSNNTSIGLGSLNFNTSGSNNVAVGTDAGKLTSTSTTLLVANNSIFIGEDSRANASNETNQIVIGDSAVGQGSNTVTIGNSSITSNKLFGRVIHADAINADESATLGQVNTTLGGFVTLATAQTITAQKTFTGSGGSDTMIISHGSGSGFALDVIKAGNGEAIRVTKTSGSGNAMTVIGGNFEAPTIVKTGGTSSQFLMADGSVNTSVLASGAYLPLAGGTLTGPLNGTTATFSGDLIAASATINTPANAVGVLVNGRNSDNFSQIRFGANTGGGAYNTIQASSTSFDIISQGNTPITFGTNLGGGGGTRMTISGAGAVTLTGALNGTSATFSGAVSANGGASGVGLNVVNNTNSRVIQLGFSTGSGSNFIQSYDGVSFQPLVLNNALTIASTGAATFSSSVTAGGNSNTFGNSSLSGKAVIIQAGSTNQAIMFKNSAGGDATLFINGTSTSVDYNFNTYSVGDALVIKNSGNVGIGTAGPATFLHVAGTSTKVLTGLFHTCIQDFTTMAAGVGGGITFMGYKTAQSAQEAFAGIDGFKENGTSGDAAGAFRILTQQSSGAGLVERMRITSGGDVGIGTAPAAGVRLHISGGVIRSVDTYNNTSVNTANLFVSSGGTFERAVSSSGRYKENIIDWDGNGLETILALKPSTFTYKESYYKHPERVMLGLIAEEVAEVCPYLADYENEDGSGEVENVRYANIVVPLIKAIQELKTEIDSLKNQIK